MAADGSGSAELSGTTPAVTIVDPDWLAARVTADNAARAATLPTLLPQLIDYLIDPDVPDATVQIIDLGAGSGANQRWLAPRLPILQRWLHVDHNPVISRSQPLPAETVIIDASVEALDDRAAHGRLPGGDRQPRGCLLQPHRDRRPNPQSAAPA
jgi:hypothetical protein